MFGQLSAFVNGNMFMGIFGDDVILRLPEAERNEVIGAGGGPFEPMAGRPMKEYVMLPTAWRDEPDRMRALGFHVTKHRILAFGLAAFVAAIAGVLSVWYNRRITPGSINLEQTINLLIIAVIGGLYRLEGAWVGALAYALIDNYSREWVPEVGNILGPARFNTIIGLVFLIIVLLSPGGLVGIWEDVRDRLRGRRPGGGTPTTTTTAGPEGGPAPGTVN